MRYSKTTPHRAFTLVEILVVITIIGILIAILLPAVQAARSAARKVSCQNNMRQVGLAVHQYTEVNGVLPPAKYTYVYRNLYGTVNASTIAHGMIPFLLPFLEQTTASSLYRYDKNWQNEVNREARNVRINVLICPDSEQTRSSRNDSRATSSIVEYFFTDYTSCSDIWGEEPRLRYNIRSLGVNPSDWRNMLRPTSQGTATKPILRWGEPSSADVLSAIRVNAVSLQSVSDGLSQSMMLFECTSRPYGKARYQNTPPPEPVRGARWADDDSQLRIGEMCNGTQIFNCTNRQEIFSLHPSGCNFLYGDGTVRFHSESMSPGAFVSRFTAFAGDLVEPL